MKLLAIAVFLGTISAHKLKWEINHTVKPAGEAHVEPPGQGIQYAPVPAHGVEGWDCVNYDLDGKLGPGMCETTGIQKKDTKDALKKEEKKK